MAVEVDSNPVTIRIVFDGAPLAGKTTAAYALSKTLGVEAETPVDDIGGRTMWFDWMSYTGGRHEGKPIRAELVTVPGQQSLNERRRHLLEWGDVVVFVADSSPEALSDTTRQFHKLRRDLEQLGERPVICIANKRDVDDAVALDQMRAELGLDDDEALIEGVAKSGAGVRQAFVFAVRAALSVYDGEAAMTDADGLLADLQRLVDDETSTDREAPSVQAIQNPTSPPVLILEDVALQAHRWPADKGLIVDEQLWRVINQIATCGGTARFDKQDCGAALRLVDEGLAVGRSVGGPANVSNGVSLSAAGKPDVADVSTTPGSADEAQVEVTAESAPQKATALRSTAAVSRGSETGPDTALTSETSRPAAKVAVPAIEARPEPRRLDDARSTSASAVAVIERNAPVRERRSEKDLERYRALRELSRRLRGGL